MFLPILLDLLAKSGGEALAEGDQVKSLSPWAFHIKHAVKEFFQPSRKGEYLFPDRQVRIFSNIQDSIRVGQLELHVPGVRNAFFLNKKDRQIQPDSREGAFAFSFVFPPEPKTRIHGLLVKTDLVQVAPSINGRSTSTLKYFLLKNKEGKHDYIINDIN